MKNPIENFIDYLFSMSAYELALLANILGIAISMPLNSNQLNIIGNFMELIGQEILTIQAKISSESSNSNININELLKSINFKMEYLEQMVDYLKQNIK